MLLEQAIKIYDDAVADIGGCGDGYCIIAGKAKGMHTNGGCRCFLHPSDIDGRKVRRLLTAARRVRDAIDGK